MIAMTAPIIVGKGYRPPLESVEKKFLLMHLSLTEETLAKHISKVNYRLSRDELSEISQNIIKVSRCFNIDPWLFAAMVEKESSFRKNAVSATGAAGLTQFTGVGLKEVNDQLGIRGRKGAFEVNIFYFNSTITQCVDASWKQLWDRVGVSEDDPTFYPLLKEEIKNDSLTALIYGAILLKTYTAHVHAKSINTGTVLKTSETYYFALQIYNGENGDAKIRYAKNVFQNLVSFYPTLVQFEFPDQKPIDE